MASDTPSEVISATNNWVQTFVVDMTLCPFAKKEVSQKRLRYTVSAADSKTHLLSDLETELEYLQAHPEIETALLIHPQALNRFNDYNQFLDDADRLLVMMELDGVFQLASFHPDYQFAGTEPNDPENFTNRSPFPMLHILREASLELAIATYPDVDAIPERNIALMNSMGYEELEGLRQSCFEGLPNSHN